MQMIRDRLTKWRYTLSAAVGLGAVCFLGWVLLKQPEPAVQGVVQGIAACLDTLIPSLFPFMVLSAYLTESGLAQFMGRYTGALLRKLFRLPGCAAPVILLSYLGGYPAGGKAISRLLLRGELTEKQAGRMLCFCVGAGPSFVLTYVGSCLLGTPSSGSILLLSVTLSGLLLGVCTGLFSKDTAAVPEHPPVPPASSPLVCAVSDASRGMLSLCAMVVVFSALLSTASRLGWFAPLTRQLLLWGMSPGNAAALPFFLTEITAGCRTGAMARASLPLFAFGLGWGGLCVHFQVFSFFPRLPVSRVKFWCFRLLHGLGSALLCRVLLPFFPEVSAASALWSDSPSVGLAASIPAAAALFLLLLIMALDGNVPSLSGKGGIFPKKPR